jgi:hypothetical protein
MFLIKLSNRNNYLIYKGMEAILLRNYIPYIA